jgi:hypothetical protein
MLTDYRILFLFLIPIILNAIFLLRARNGRQWRWGRDSGESRDFRWWEAGISFVIFLVVMLGAWHYGRDQRISNFHEQIGGYITNKYFVDGEHEESYQTCTGSGDDRTCTTHYYTQYHREFIVENNTGDWWDGWRWSEIVDTACEGCAPDNVPQYYAEAYIGKPVSLDNQYANYIAAMNEDIYRNTYKGLAAGLPDICGDASDYRASATGVYKAIPLGFNNDSRIRAEVYAWNFVPDPALVNYQTATIPLYMDTIFAYLGTTVQGDVHLYVVNSTNTSYADMCLAKWKNGAKNSVYVFLFGQSDAAQTSYYISDVYVGYGVDGTKRTNSGLQYENEQERSNAYLKFDLRNQLLDYVQKGGTLDREQILRIVFDNVSTKFVRQEMADFKDLKNYVHPTNGWIVLMTIVLLILDTVVHFMFANNDY